MNYLIILFLFILENLVQCDKIIYFSLKIALNIF